MLFKSLAAVLAGYFIGSIPSAYLVTRCLVGVDIRQVGDRNMGAKNTFKIAGPIAGILVAVSDVAKGGLAVALARELLLPEYVAVTVGASAVLGHIFPAYLRLRGGQGMATMVGALILLFPCEALYASAAFGIVLASTRKWDFSTIIGFASLLLVAWLSDNRAPHFLYIAMMIPLLYVKRLREILTSRK